ncbi:glycosyltransferase, partial [Paratractidigestivibacter sp.]|uniref:glycosyltransferase n=1 Tax=Paratractidigestivibacter sp. TaxID=2847316 RepID=UPI002AC9B867
IPPYQHVFAYQRELRRLFERESWRIVHSHINALSAFSLRAAKKADVPVRIAHSHSAAGKGEPIKNAIKAVLRMQANRYPTHRAACTEHAAKWLFGKGVDYRLVRNSIELGRYSFNAGEREKCRGELGLSDSTFAVGHVGRLTTQKNQSFLVDAFAELLKVRPDSVLFLVGDGADRKKIASRARELGIADKVRLLGQRDDAWRLYQAFDVFALPSIYEGLGMVAVEAQAAALPCVCSTEVPADVDLTTGCSHIELAEGPGRWATALLEASTVPSRGLSPSDAFGLKAYDIEASAVELGDWYIKLYEGAVKQ